MGTLKTHRLNEVLQEEETEGWLYRVWLCTIPQNLHPISLFEMYINQI